MNEQRIREIAEQSSYHAENSVDYYSGIVDGLTWEAKILKARDLKFAELIVKECIRVPYDMWDKAELNADVAVKIEHRIKEHFGVEE